MRNNPQEPESIKQLAIGTVQFGINYGVANEYGRVSLEEGGRILSAATGYGIDTLDTAINYGESESTLGGIGVTGWKIITKLPEIPNGCTDIAQWTDDQISGSLARLGVDQLHAVLLHRPEQLLGNHGNKLVAALEKLKTKGLTKKIGVSVYSPEELEPLFEKINFDIVQAPLNILDRRLIDSGWALRLRNMGVELHTRSAFLQGLLLMPASRRPVKFDRWLPLWVEWERWLNETGLTPLNACLRYLFSVDEIDKVVVGVDTLHQFLEIVTAAGDPLTSLPNWRQPIDNDLLNPAEWRHL
jgi:aryl-alcohol dehydrogenase-like predicted oxidoreductase